MSEENIEVPEFEELDELSEPGQPKSGRPLFKILLVVSLVIIFGAGAALGWYLSQDGDSSDQGVLPFSQDVDEDVDENDQPAATTDTGAVKIDWLEIDDQYPKNSDLKLTRIFFPEVDATTMSELGAGPMTYMLGEVTSGQYEGYQLQHFTAGLPSMGIYIVSFYLLVPEQYTDKSVILDKYAGNFSYDESLEDLLWNDEWEQLVEDFEIDTTTVISELEYGDINVYDTSGNKYVPQGFGYRAEYPYMINTDKYEVVAQLANGTELKEYVHTDDDLVYYNQSHSNAFFGVREDGRLLWYDIDIPFFTESVAGEEASAELITWQDGSSNENHYIKRTHTGCGASDTVRVIEDQEIIDGLVVAGSYSVDGDSGSVYAPADYDTEYYREAFDGWLLFVEDGTWEEYVAGYPYIYWQDPFGRWIEFMSLAIVPPAECGKPVIYLYPEEPTEIGVKIELKTMSVSEPDYGDGWNVVAYPDGGLVNLSDGEKYPYLFWEGTGKFYASPEYYWVVAQDQVELFLVDTLSELGFNHQEIADFNEFWLPLMQEARYYKIGFHGTGFMNQLAPLDFTVRPNSLLRVLMDFEPLAAPIAENPPRYIPGFERNGFVVTEWGGVLR